MKNTTSLSIFAILIMAILACCFLLPSLSATPHRLLSPDGVLAWQPNSPYLHGGGSVDGGDRALLTWSEDRADDGVREIRYQIMDRNGERAFEPSSRLSDPEYPASYGIGASDDEAYYVAWFAVSPDDDTFTLIHAQKFDDQGQPLWGDSEEAIEQFQVEPEDRNSGLGSFGEALIPDGAGGCYYLTSFGMFAIDSEGRIRNDWPWTEEISEGVRYSRVYPDCEGGFWIVARDYRGDHTVYLINHYYPDGHRLFEDDFAPLPLEGVPEGTSLSYHSLVAIPGGLVAQWRISQQYGLCVLDEQGNLVDEDHFIELPHRITSSAHVSLTDGSLVFVDDYDLDEVSRLFAVKYDPVNNDLPWGEEGVVVKEFPKSENRQIRLITQTADGDVIIPAYYHRAFSKDYSSYMTEVNRIDSDRGRAVHHAVNLESFAGLRYLIPTEDGGCWLGGNWLNYNINSMGPSYLNYLSPEGQPAVDRHMDFGETRRRTTELVNASLDPAGNCQLWLQNDNQLVQQTVSAAGIQGDPAGQPIRDYGEDRLIWELRYQVGDRFIRAWIADPNNSIKWEAFDRDGRQLWCDSVEQVENANWSLQGDVSDDQSSLLLSSWRVVNDTYQTHLFSVNLNDGSLNWTRQVVTLDRHRIGANRFYRYLSSGAQTVSLMYWQLSDDSVSVDTYDLDGARAWQSPAILSLEYPVDDVIGMVSDNEGGAWVGFTGHRQDTNGDVWLRHISTDGEVTDSAAFFSEGVDWGEMALVQNGDLIWLVPNGIVPQYNRRQTPGEVFGIQALREGEPVFDEAGFRVTIPQDALMNAFMVVPCPNGDMYVMWGWDPEANPNHSSYSYLRVTLLDTDGQFREGWDERGVPVFDDQVSVNNLNAWAVNENDLAILNRQTAQYITDREINGLPKDSALLPLELALTKVYPNPFNNSVCLTYQLPQTGQVQLRVFDVNGRLGEVVEEGERIAGIHRVNWNADKFPSRLYLARLEGGGQTQTRKLTLIR